MKTQYEIAQGIAQANGRIFACAVWSTLALETRTQAHIKLCQALAAMEKAGETQDRRFPWESFMISEYLPSYIFPYDVLTDDMGECFANAAYDCMFDQIKNHNPAGI